jgi:nucleoside-diphosphate-sugar epimerase
MTFEKLIAAEESASQALAHKLEGKPVLVSGGGGFVGYELCRQLRLSGIAVRSLGRNHYSQLEPLGVEQIQGDLTNGQVAEKALTDCAVVFHTAAKVGAAGSAAEFDRINLEGTRQLLTLAKKHAIGIFVHTSTPSVVFEGGDLQGADETLPLARHHHSHYTRTKALAETLVLEANCAELKTCALRPHLVWGPGDRHILPRLVSRRRSGRLMRVGDGQNIVDVTHVREAARSHVVAALALINDPDRAAGRAYFISQGQPVKLWWMIDQMLVAAGEKPVQGAVSRKTAVRIGAILETLFRVFGLTSEPPMTRWIAEELATSHWFSIHQAKDRLGYEPIISVEEGLADLQSWCQSHPNQILGSHNH